MPFRAYRCPATLSRNTGQTHPADSAAKILHESPSRNEPHERFAPSPGEGEERFRPERFRLNAPESPLQIGDRSLLPSVTRVFRTNQELYVYLESYGGKEKAKSGETQATGAAPPQVALVFFRGGIKISEAGPFTGKLEKSPANKAEYFVKIPLDKFPPGRYWMQVNVLDPDADQVAFARVPLAIMPAPSATEPARPPGATSPSWPASATS